MLASKYETALGKVEANYQPLSPIAFLERSALVYPAKPAIIDGERVITYADMWRRCRQAADALRKAGVGKDDTVSVLSPNSVSTRRPWVSSCSMPRPKHSWWMPS